MSAEPREINFALADRLQTNTKASREAKHRSLYEASARVGRAEPIHR